MTTSMPDATADNDGQEHEKPVAEYESVHVRERLVKRTCAWCGTELEYSGTGRPPKFCTAGHRKRWHERKKAKAELGRADDTREPVREVIERTETIVRTIVRKGPAVLQPVPTRPALAQADLRFPESFDDWYTMLALLQVDASKLRGHYRENELRDVLRQLVIEDFPGTVTTSTRPPSMLPRSVEDWYAALRGLLADLRGDMFTEAQRADLARIFGIAVEHLRPGAPGQPAPEQQPAASRAERRRLEREARKGRR